MWTSTNLDLNLLFIRRTEGTQPVVNSNIFTITLWIFFCVNTSPYYFFD